jgi:hypothetical protein
MRWDKVKLHSNWDLHEYRVKGQKISLPKKVFVKWPDGTEEVCSTLEIYNGGTISDHSQRYRIKTTHWYISTKHNGVRIKVPIDKVKIRVDSDNHIVRTARACGPVEG